MFHLKGGPLTAKHIHQLCEIEEELVTTYWGPPCGMYVTLS